MILLSHEFHGYAQPGGADVGIIALVIVLALIAFFAWGVARDYKPRK